MQRLLGQVDLHLFGEHLDRPTVLLRTIEADESEIHLLPGAAYTKLDSFAVGAFEPKNTSTEASRFFCGPW